MMDRQIPQANKLALILVQARSEAGRLSLPKTMQALDDATREIGVEILGLAKSQKLDPSLILSDVG